MSVLPVCCPLRLHAISPCLIERRSRSSPDGQTLSASVERTPAEANGPPPRNVITDFQPFGVLVEHRIDDVDEGLVAGKETVPAG
jgi:hypothetical protein